MCRQAISSSLTGRNILNEVCESVKTTSEEECGEYLALRPVTVTAVTLSLAAWHRTLIRKFMLMAKRHFSSCFWLLFLFINRIFTTFLELMFLYVEDKKIVLWKLVQQSSPQPYGSLVFLYTKTREVIRILRDCFALKTHFLICFSSISLWIVR